MTRKELIKAATAAKGKLTGHLAECAECRDYVLMLRSLNATNRLPLADAPKAWIDRAAALAQSEGALKRTARILADLIFDSWTVPHPVGVRGETATDQRRLQFETPELTFDLHAERRDTDWAFVAQTSGTEVEMTGLKAGNKTVVPDSGGMYQWSSKRPPKKISLITERAVIDLPELVWKRPQKK